ncbi:putative Ig domain-containing protein [Dactylosporangium sp. CA-092794]|uniref:putative Ig domain-containing protein n=1 Tax=Dactylosporangium sp. CA-092794 TaxID=3239929 RepID=UPI003D91C796
MPPDPRRDDGFSLVETLTAIAVMGVVMTALTTFFVSATNTVNKQRGRQMAIRIASDGIELVKSMNGPSLAAGRGAQAVAEQFKNDKVPGLDLAALQLTMVPATDPGAAGKSPVLPLDEAVPVNDAVFTRHYFVGTCVMDPRLAGNAPCGVSALVANPLSFYRVVVAVTWQNTRACTSDSTQRGVCSYITDTLVAAATTDPVFNPGVTVVPPLPDNPGNQTSEVSVPITPLSLTATTSYPPVTWSADALPPGLTITNAGVVSGTPTTAGTYVVRVAVQDNASSNDASFNWVVKAAPAITQPPSLTWTSGSAVAYTMALTGGTAPFTWTATDLPPGLSMSSAGVIGGTLGGGTRFLPTITVRDALGVTNALVVPINVTVSGTGLRITAPTSSAPDKTGTKGQSITSWTATATGGTAPYTWTITGAPTGIALANTNNTAVLTGKPSATGSFVVTLTVTDRNGAAASFWFVWKIS